MAGGPIPTNLQDMIQLISADKRPRSVDEATRMLYAEEKAKREKQWLAFRDMLNDSGLTIPIEEWPVPTGWDSKNVGYIYGHLNEQIKCSNKQILNEDPFFSPEDNWEELLAPVFTFDVGHLSYRPMETYDDGVYATVALQDGSSVNISRMSDDSYLTFPPRDNCVAALEKYIYDGVRVSGTIKSASNRTWRKAEAIFNKHRTIITPQLAKILEELGRLLHEARTELVLDIEDYACEQEAAEAEAAKSEGEGKTKSTKRRAGVSVVMGREAHPAIDVESGKWITVFDKARHEKRYFIRGEKNWILMNRFLSSLKRHDDHSANHWPVDFNSNEYSATRDYFRAFVDTYVERQPAAVKRAHHLYESRARIRIELLGNPDKDARIGDITDAIHTPKKKNPHR